MTSTSKDFLRIFPTPQSLAAELVEKSIAFRVAQGNLRTPGLIRQSHKTIKEIASSEPILDNFFLKRPPEGLPIVGPTLDDVPSATIAKDRLLRRFAKDTLENK